MSDKPRLFPSTREEVNTAYALRIGIRDLFHAVDQLTMTPQEVWREMVSLLRDTSIIEGPHVRLTVTERNTPFAKTGPKPEMLKIEGDFGPAMKKAFAAGKPPKSVGRSK